MNVSNDDYVQLELLNQQVTELDQTIKLIEEQQEHSIMATAMLTELKTAKKGQEMLIPIGSGAFLTVNAGDIKQVKVAVGAGIVVDRSASDTLLMLNKQMGELKAQQQQSYSLYDEVVSRIMNLQKKIESSMKDNKK